MNEPRRIDVPPLRLERWVSGFAESHGESTWSLNGSAYLLTGADGSWARLSAWQSAAVLPPDLPVWSESPRRLGIILIRRGGYAVGIVDGSTFVSHKCGTKYVQGRTAAGGQSQQRFARRRANQADGLVGAVAERVVTMLAPKGLDALVVGGDKPLIEHVLDDSRLAGLRRRRRREFFGIPDPRFSVLKSVAERARSVTITVQNASTHTADGT